MQNILSLLFTGAAFITVISVLVFVHEFGHYIIAKWAGVKIEMFSVGFGRELWGRTDKSGTRWKISELPLGGYVKMYGDASEISTPLQDIDSLPEEEKTKTFHHKPLYKKAAIVAAGPIANFLLTITIFTAFAFTGGLNSTEPVIGEVLDNTPAQAAGLHPGDRVLAIDNQKVMTFNDIPRMIVTNLGTPVTLNIQRGKDQFDVTLTPKQVTEDQLGNSYTHPLIGIATKNIKVEEIGLPRAVWEATKMTYHFCITTLDAVGQIISGKRSFFKTINGPISMAKMSGHAAQKGPGTFFMVMAYISANLGLVNLFPIPVLDGGHLLYYGIEVIQGRPLARRFQEYGLRIGFAIVAMLMTSAIFSDIYKWLMTLKG